MWAPPVKKKRMPPLRGAAATAHALKVAREEAAAAEASSKAAIASAKTPPQAAVATKKRTKTPAAAEEAADAVQESESEGAAGAAAAGHFALSVGMGIASKGSEPAAGDHIVVHRGLYTHHGIYLGNGRIAHKVAGTHTLGVAISSVDASVRLPTGGVVLTDVCGFCPEAKSTDDFSLVEVVHYAQCFHPDDTVELALAAARGPRTSVSVSAAPLAAPYQLMSHNCEHFATYCKTGEHVSLQVLAVRGAIHRFGALAAGLLAGTATLARLEYAERTTTRVEHHPGGALGLKRRKVVTTETEVDVGRVLTGAAVIGLVSATTFGIVSRLQAHIREGKRYILAVRLCGPDGRPAGCDCSQVITVPRRVVRRGKAALRAFLVQEMEGAPLAEEMRFYDATTRQFVSIHTDVAVALPRCATVTVVLAPAGAKAPAMA